MYKPVDVVAVRAFDERSLRRPAPLLGPNARFFLLWAVIPAALRLLTLWRITPPNDTPLATLSAISGRAVTALPQDLCVAAQAFLLALLLKFIFVWRGRSVVGRVIAAVPLTILFALVQFYVLFDFLLYWKTSVRMDQSFFSFLPSLNTFRSSAEAYGLAPLIFGVMLLTALTYLAGQFIYRTLPTLSLSFSRVMWLLVIIGTSLGSIRYTPSELAYAVDNVVLADEMALLTEALRHDPNEAPLKDEAALLSGLRMAEEFEPVSPQYPLLKNTTGFTGDKLFDVRIDARERPHVIFLQMESFRAANIGVLGAKHPASPEFDRLSKEGILFSKFYANGVQTTRGTMASLFGVLPHFAPSEVQVTNSEMPLIGVPDLFHQRGYRNAFIYSSPLDFENTGNFVKQHGFDEVQGVNELLKAFPKAWRTSWGVHDEYLLRHVADYLEQQDLAGQPTFIYTLTISNHHPWQVPPTFTPPKFDVPGGGEYPQFLQSFAYSDHCLGGFVRLLKQRGLDKKTILFIYADTSTPMGEHYDNYMLVNYLYEENVRIPLLILAPGRIDQPQIIDDVGSQVDILPTVMDLFDMKGLNHGVGTSLRRSVPERAAYFNNPFALQYVGMRQGDWKYIFTVRSQMPALYNVTDDPGEKKNLVGEQLDVARTMHARAVGLNQWMSRQYWREGFAPRDAATP